MSNMGNQLISDIFKALSHPTRLQIVKLLRKNCYVFAMQLESEQSNTSHHSTASFRFEESGHR